VNGSNKEQSMSESKPLDGRTAVVTGASAGIGLAVAEHLFALGSRVVINARRKDKLDSVARGLDPTGKVVASVAGDASESATITAMLSAARVLGGNADLVVVSAGRGLKGSVTNSQQCQWEEMIRTNILGAARLIREAGNAMAAQAQANGVGWVQHPCDLIVIGSVVGKHVSPFSSMYGGTKFAVAGMVEGVRRELGPKGVRVTLIEPGFVTSEFQGVAGYDPKWYDGVVERIGPVLLPADVARVIGFVAQQPAHVHLSNVLVRPTRQDYP